MENMKILIAENNSCLELPLKNLFKSMKWSAKIEWISTAEDAIELIKKMNFDLIIADYTLAGITNGLQLWEYCQKKLPLTPFVMMSGIPVEDFLRLTEGNRAPPYLPKPFSLRDLRQLLETLLSKQNRHPRKKAA